MEIVFKDIHNRETQYKCALKSLQDADVLKDNKELALGFHEHECDLKRNAGTKQKTLTHLKRLAVLLGNQSFKSVTRDQMVKKIIPAIEKFKVIVRNRPEKTIQASTVSDYKKTLKKFYKWINGGEEYPDAVKGFKIPTHECKLQANDMITEQELLKMLSAMSSIRDKAILAVLFEAHCRIGEFLNMRIKDVKHEDDGCFLSIPQIKGKKEATYRTVFIKFAKPYLSHWLSIHPQRNDRNAQMWINEIGGYRPMAYACVKKILRVAARRAGVQKPINPHNWRHSGSTYEAGLGVSPMITAERNGHGLAMAMRYGHLSGKQQKDEILRKRGDKPDDIPTELLVKVCPKCKSENEPTSKSCDTCGTDLSLTEHDVIKQLQKGQNEMEKKVDDLHEQMVVFIKQMREEKISETK